MAIFVSFPAGTYLCVALLSGCGNSCFNKSWLWPHNLMKVCPCRLGKSDSSVQPGTWANLCEDRQLQDEVFEALDLQCQQGACVTRDMLYRALKVCITNKNLVAGRRIHALTVQNGYEANNFLGTHLIRMYASHGCLAEAHHVFSNLPAPNASVWTTIIQAYSEHGQPEHAINLYREMRQSGVEADSYLYSTALRACSSGADLTSGRLVHWDVIENRFEEDVFVASGALVSMYAKCRSLGDAAKFLTA